MLMTKKSRLAVLLIPLCTFFLVGLLLVLFSALNLVPRDPGFFSDENYHAKYETSGYARMDFLEISVTAPGENLSRARVTAGPREILLEVNRDGYLLRNGRVTDEVTPFWLKLGNPMLGQFEGASRFKVRDVTGLVGDPGAVYDLTLKGSFILWDRILQSQASYRAELATADGQVAATAVYDATCGLLFELTSHLEGRRTIRLKATDFVISRNREFQIKAYVLLAALTSLFLLGWAIRGRRAGSETIDFRKNVFTAVLVGYMALAVDTCLDIWYPFLPGTVGLLAIHLFMVLLFFLVAGRWGLIALVELLFASSFSSYNAGLVPMYSYCPGLLLTWIAWIFSMGYRPVDDKEIARATGG